jgi:WD40 repeat protein
LNDGKIPNPNVVRVAPGTGYHRVEGNGRALRNGRVSDPPPEIPNDTIRNLCAPLQVSCGIDGAIRVWGYKQRRLQQEILAGSALRLAELHAASGLLAASGDDLVIRVYDVQVRGTAAAGAPYRRLKTQGGQGAWSGSDTGSLYISGPCHPPQVGTGRESRQAPSHLPFHGVQAGRRVRRLAGHTDRLTAVHWASDARWLISASMDGTTRVWDIPAAQCLQVSAAVSLRLSHSVSLTVSPSVSPPLCLPVCLPVCLSHCVSQCVSLTVSPSVSPTVSPTVVSLAVSPTVSPSPSLPPCLSHRLSHRVPHCLSHRLSHSVSRTDSPTVSPPTSPPLSASLPLLQVMHLGAPVTALSLSPTMDLLATTHVGRVGLYLWANRPLYLGTAGAAAAATGAADPTPVDIRLPSVSDNVVRKDGAAAEAGDGAGGPVEDDDQPVHEVEEAVAAAAAAKEAASSECNDARGAVPVAAGAVTLSRLPKSQWQSLMHLDTIKQRNKPIQPPTKPEAAPFFLPTVGSVSGSTVFDVTGSNAGPAPGSKLLRGDRSAAATLSEFVRRLRAGAAANDFAALTEHVRSLGPSALDVELQVRSEELAGWR